MVPDISNKHSVFIFRVRQSKDCEGTMFLEHIMNHSSNDTVSYSSHEHSCKNLKTCLIFQPPLPTFVDCYFMSLSLFESNNLRMAEQIIIIFYVGNVNNIYHHLNLNNNNGHFIWRCVFACMESVTHYLFVVAQNKLKKSCTEVPNTHFFCVPVFLSQR